MRSSVVIADGGGGSSPPGFSLKRAISITAAPDCQPGRPMCVRVFYLYCYSSAIRNSQEQKPPAGRSSGGQKMQRVVIRGSTVPANWENSVIPTGLQGKRGKPLRRRAACT